MPTPAEQDLNRLAEKYLTKGQDNAPILSPQQHLNLMKERYMAQGRQNVAEDFMPALETPEDLPQNVLPTTAEPAAAEATRVQPDLHKTFVDRDPFLFREMTDWWPDFMKAGYSQSITGLAHHLISGEAPFDLSKYEPGMVEDIASTVLSFLMPLDIMTFAVGGVAGRAGTSLVKSKVVGKLIKSGVDKTLAERAVSRASTRLLARTATGAAESGVRLGIYSGVQTAAATMLEKGYPDLIPSIKAALEGTALGMMLGATGGVTRPLAKRGLPGKAGQVGAEIGTFAAGSAALELRLPNLDDLARAAGIVIALKLEGQATKWTKRRIAESIMERMVKKNMELWDAMQDFIDSGDIKRIAKEIPPLEGEKPYKFPISPLPDKYNLGVQERIRAKGEKPEIPYEEDVQITWMKQAKTSELIDELQRDFNYTDEQVIKLSRPEMQYILSGGRIGTEVGKKPAPAPKMEIKPPGKPAVEEKGLKPTGYTVSDIGAEKREIPTEKIPEPVTIPSEEKPEKPRVSVSEIVTKEISEVDLDAIDERDLADLEKSLADLDKQLAEPKPEEKPAKEIEPKPEVSIEFKADFEKTPQDYIIAYEEIYAKDVTALEEKYKPELETLRDQLKQIKGRSKAANEQRLPLNKRVDEIEAEIGENRARLENDIIDMQQDYNYLFEQRAKAAGVSEDQLEDAVTEFNMAISDERPYYEYNYNRKISEIANDVIEEFGGTPAKIEEAFEIRPRTEAAEAKKIKLNIPGRGEMEFESVDAARAYIDGLKNKIAQIRQKKATKPKVTAAAAPVVKAEEPPAEAKNLTDHFWTMVHQKESPKSPTALIAKAREFDPKLTADKDNDFIYDSYEGALVKEYHERVKGIDDFDERLKIAQEIEDMLPSRRRTLEATSLAQQKFSTPLTLAEGMHQAAQLKADDKILEPTAGTGSLVAPISKWTTGVFVNEKDPTRTAILEGIYGKAAIEKDYLEWNPHDSGIRPDVIIMNPPWGSAARSKVARVTEQPDLAAIFVDKAVNDLEGGGRLVALLPKTIIPGESVNAFRWISELKKQGTVRAIIMSPAGAYHKGRGTDIASVMVVFDKFESADFMPPALREEKPPYIGLVEEQLKDPSATVEMMERLFPDVSNYPYLRNSSNWKGWKSAIDEIASRPYIKEKGGVSGERPISGQPIPSTRGAGKPGAQPGRPISGVGGEVGEIPGERPRPATAVEGPGAPRGYLPETVPPGAAARPGVVSTGVEAPGPKTEFPEGPGAVPPAQRGVERPPGERKGRVSGPIFTEYIPQHPDRAGNRHPRRIVVTKSAVGAGLPDISDVKLTKKVRRLNKRAVISDEQFDFIARGEKANDAGHGFLQGHDVGTGKTRIVMGHAIEWFETDKARRVLYITVNNDNIQKVMAEFNDLHEGNFPYKMVNVGAEYADASISRTTKDEDIPKFDKTIYFVHSYNLVNFLPKLKDLDLDGLIADESHKFLNVQGSMRGIEWLNLHNYLLKRNARIIYASATAARNIEELEYLYGLKEWGPGEFDLWIRKKKGDQVKLSKEPGVTDYDIDKLKAKMKSKAYKSRRLGSEFTDKETEQIIRELTASGKMMSGDMLREGVEFDIGSAPFRGEEVKKVNEGVALLREIRQAYNKYRKIDKTLPARFGIESNLQNLVKSLYFNYRLDRAVEKARESLKNGEQPVISLIRVTGDEQSVDRNGFDDVDTKAGLPPWLTNSIERIPIQAAEKDPVTGERVPLQIVPEAVAAKQRLYDLAAGFWPRLRHPVEKLIDEFGIDQVAPLVGSYSTPDGKKINVSFKKRGRYTEEFQSGTRPVAIISSAAKQGIDLHDVNHNRRHMIVIDYEWTADVLKQALGRVDRTGQVSAPKVSLLNFGTSAERRFIGTLANRIRDLGATAKGAARSTGTEKMAIFEYGGSTHYEALRRAWNYWNDKYSFTDEEKNHFLHLKEFRDENYPDEPRKRIQEVSLNTLQRFWRAFQTIPVEEGNEIGRKYDIAYSEVNKETIQEEISSLERRGVDVSLYQSDIDSGADWLDIKRKYHHTGQIIREGKLTDDLMIHEVRSIDKGHYGLVSGMITDNLYLLRDFLPTSSRTGHVRLEYIDFNAAEKSVSGLVIPSITRFRELAGRFKTKGFGLKVTIDDLPAALKAGEKITLSTGWTVHLGQRGERAGKYILHGPAMAEISEEVGGQRRMKYGIKYHPAAFYFLETEQQLKDFVRKIGLGAEVKASETKEEAAGVTMGRLSVEQERIPGKTVSKAQIKDAMERAFEVPIRTKHIAGGGRAGITKTPQKVIRTKGWGDIDVYSHEIAHVIDKNPEWRELKQLAGYRTELPTLDYDYPKKDRATEGWAEFIRHWLTGSADPASQAPTFYEAFEKWLNTKPELKDKLFGIRTLIDRYREQGSFLRAYGQIDFKGDMMKGPFGERVKQLYRTLGTKMWNEIAPIEWFEKEVRGLKGPDAILKAAKEGKIKPEESPYLMATADIKTSESKARAMILWGTFDYGGNTTGKSLREVIAPVSKSKQMMREFLVYAYARRAVELHTGTGGLRGPKEPGLHYKDAVYLEKLLKSTKFEKAFKELVGFENRVMDYLVEAGGISEEVARHIRALNPSYIPLKRVFESGEWIPATGGKKYANLPQAIKRLKGSKRPIVNPLESIIKTTAQMINIADKIRVGRAIIDLANFTPGAGKWVEKIPPPVKATRITLQRIMDELNRAGIDLSESSMNEIIDVMVNGKKYIDFFFPQSEYRGKDNIVSFWVNGERQFYEIHPELYRCLKAMDSPNFNWMVRFLSAPARSVRLGATGLQAGFGLVTNPIRDAFTFSLQTEFSRGTPDLIAKGFFKKWFPKEKMHLLFKRSGTDLSQFLGMDRRQIYKAIREVQNSTVKQKALHVVGHPLDALGLLIEGTKDIFSVTEAAPRIAEFQAAYEQGKARGLSDTSARILAANAGADVTINFRRMGQYGMVINQIIPFWNAAVQGIAKFNRFARLHPVKATFKALTYLTAPTMILWYLNHDEQWYKELPAWQKYGYWNIPVGWDYENDRPREIVRVIRPFEWGWTFAAGPEMALEYFEYKNPQIITEYLSQGAEQMLPFPPFMNPTAIEIPMELYANYDFFRDRQIDPYFEVEYKEPGDRFSPYTTETAKFIGRSFNLSPRKIEHLLESSTGGLGMDILRAAEEIGQPSKIESGADIPVVGRLFARQRSPESREKTMSYLRQKEKQRINKLYEADKDEEAEKRLDYWNRKYPDYAI